MVGKKQLIDIKSWNRRSTYKRFLSYEYPYLTICSPVDVTSIVNYTRINQISFYGMISWVVLKAVNENEALKLRIQDDLLVLYDSVGLSFSTLKPNKSFGYSSIVEYNSMTEFLDQFQKSKEAVESNLTINYEERDDVIYVTCVPMVRITSVVNPMKLGVQDSIPRICWGRYYKEGDKFIIDISIQVHHSLADGLHIGEFFQCIHKISEEIVL